MKDRSALIVGGLTLLLVVMPLGYLVHISPRFPGSLAGSLLGIIGATLMLIPLAYSAVKRIPALRSRVTPLIGMPALLRIHIYAGILGPILAVLHSAHRYDSAIGIWLTGLMLIVVVSGYTGRYLLGRIGRAARGRRSDLAALHAMLVNPAKAADDAAPAGLAGEVRRLVRAPNSLAAGTSRANIALALADVELAVRAEEGIERLFRTWLKLHILIATILYVLLALHVWAGLYFGLRWL